MGLVPVFVDVDVDTMNVDLDDLEARITDKTRGVLAVHVLGNMCDMDRLIKICTERDLLLVEDTCESLGARTAVNTWDVRKFWLVQFLLFAPHHDGGRRHGRVSDARGRRSRPMSTSAWVDARAFKQRRVTRTLRAHRFTFHVRQCRVQLAPHGNLWRYREVSTSSS